MQRDICCSEPRMESGNSKSIARNNAKSFGYMNLVSMFYYGALGGYFDVQT